MRLNDRAGRSSKGNASRTLHAPHRRPRREGEEIRWEGKGPGTRQARCPGVGQARRLTVPLTSNHDVASPLRYPDGKTVHAEPLGEIHMAQNN